MCAFQSCSVELGSNKQILLLRNQDSFARLNIHLSVSDVLMYGMRIAKRTAKALAIAGESSSPLAVSVQLVVLSDRVSKACPAATSERTAYARMNLVVDMIVVCLRCESDCQLHSRDALYSSHRRRQGRVAS